MKNPKFNSPCFGCTERTVEPNCHSEKCEKWAKFQKELAEYNTMIFKGRKKSNEALDFQITSIKNMKNRDKRRKRND